MWVGLSVKRMKVEGKSLKTIQNYVRSIRHFVSSFIKHPKVVSQNEIKNYLFQITKEKNFGPATHNLHVSGIKYFYNTVLGIKDKDEALIKKKVPQQLFEVLSHNELDRIFAVEKNLRNRLIIKAGYAFGLRVDRAVHLRLSDFDIKRNLLFVKGAKGKKDRFIMLSQDFLADLKTYLKYHHIEDVLFPGTHMGTCISSRFANHILHNAAKKAGITKKISYHTLRRSFATHLHEAGQSLRDIQVVMGHSTSRTTERYTKVSKKHISKIKNPLDNLTEIARERGNSNQNNTVESPQNFNKNQSNKFSQQAGGNNGFISAYKHKIVYRGK